MVRGLLDIDGADPIDTRLGGVQADDQAPRTRWSSRRLALGLAATPMPAFALLLAGQAMGPDGLGLLTTGLLSALEPATAAALVALGILIGLDVDLVRRSGAPRLLLGAAMESGVTLVAVAGLFTVLARLALWPWDGLPLLPLLVGVCAAASATAARGGQVTSVATRIGDLDDVLPVAVGACLLAYAAGESPYDGAALIGTTAGLAAVIALAGSLLATDTTSEGEQRVYATGVLLLLTGVAAYLSASALFVGMIAGAAWNALQPIGRERLARDFRYLQHPIVVLLLIVAGAQAHTSLVVIAFGGVLALGRLFAKMLGGLLAASVVGGVGRMGLALLASGVGGVAFALNAFRATGTGDAFLGIVVWGAILSDLLALLVSPHEVTE